MAPAGPTISQAEKKRLLAEKQAVARDEASAVREARAAAMRGAARGALQETRTPDWLKRIHAGLETCVERDDEEPASRAVCAHARNVASIIRQIEACQLAPDCAAPIQDELEYVLELARAGADGSDELAAFGEAIYEDVVASSSAGPVSGHGLERSSGLRDASNAPDDPLRRLEAATSRDELLLALRAVDQMRPPHVDADGLVAEARAQLAHLESVAEATEKRLVFEKPPAAFARAEAAPPAAKPRASRSSDVDAADDRAPRLAVVVGKIETHGHSTHCAGLKQLMAILAQRAGVAEIVAGPLRETSTHAPELDLVLQRGGEMVNGAFKLVARKGHTAQDVFLRLSPQLTALGALPEQLALDEVSAALECYHRRGERARGGDDGGRGATDALMQGGRNLSAHEAQQRASELNKQAQQAAHQVGRQREATAEKAHAIKQQIRSLKAAVKTSAGDAKVDIAAHAARNEKIYSGETERGKGAFGGRARTLPKKQAGSK